MTCLALGILLVNLSVAPGGTDREITVEYYSTKQYRRTPSCRYRVTMMMSQVSSAQTDR